VSTFGSSAKPEPDVDCSIRFVKKGGVMQEDRWERITDLFSELAAVPPERRDSILHRACGDDTGLCAELESLLRAHDQVSGPLDRTLSFALHGAESDESVDQPETLVGSYRLLRPIGEGGMGSVCSRSAPTVSLSAPSR
jgi:serine/threonine-protein kinase